MVLKLNRPRQRSPWLRSGAAILALTPRTGALVLALVVSSLATASTRAGTATASAGSRRLVPGANLGPSGGEIRSLALTASGERRLVGTAHGDLFLAGAQDPAWVATAAVLPGDAVIDNIVVHPTDVERAYAAYWRPNGSGGLVISEDGGERWRKLDIPGEPSLRALAIAPSAPSTLYAGGVEGIWRSDDGGQSWRDVSGSDVSGSDHRCTQVETLVVDPRRPDLVYAGTWRLPYRSVDGGTTWRRIARGMNIDRDVFTIALDRQNPDAMLAGTCGYIYASQDRGQTWRERRQGLPHEHRRIHTLVADPSHPDRIYAGTRGGLYRSDDRGTSWLPRVLGVSVSAIAVGADGRVDVATEERGILTTTDGEAFAEDNHGLMASRVIAMDAAGDDLSRLVVLVGDSPTTNRLLYTADAGLHWAQFARGTLPSSVVAVRIVEWTAAGPRILVASHGAAGNGLSSGDVTGDVAGEGVTGGPWWLFDPSRGTTTLAPPPGALEAVMLAGDGNDSLVVVATDAVLAVRGLGPRSRIAASPAPRWQALAAGPFTAVDHGGGRLLAVGNRRIATGRLATLSTEGVTLFAAPTLPLDVRDVRIDPGNPERAYAITRTSVVRSDDGGHTWQPLPLPWPGTDLRRLRLDAQDPSELVVLDASGVIFRGHEYGRHWLVLDPTGVRAVDLRIGRPGGVAVVATLGRALLVVPLSPQPIPRKHPHRR